MKLSILIATMPGREACFLSLVTGLLRLVEVDGDGIVEIIHDCGPAVIGKKRNDLLKKAKGEYVVFVDDDDMVHSNYIWLILKAIESAPDCIGISGTVVIKDEIKQWHISKEYGEWKEENGVYLRTPNHISPVRRELALKAGFPEIKFSEDHGYSMRLLPHLKTEVIIPGNIYFYTPSKK